MSQAHALVGQVAVVLGAIAAIGAVALVVLRRPVGTIYLGGLVWVVGAVAVAALLGIATAVTTAPPRDALHLLYGALATLALPVGAVLAVGRPARQQTIVVAIATIVLVILLVRLLQTGG